MTDAHQPTLTEEGAGYVVTCSCGWLIYHVQRSAALDAHRKHKPRPKD